MSDTYVLTSANSLPLNKWQKITLTLLDTNAVQALAAASVKAQIILLKADDANPTDVYIGPTSDADFDTLPPGRVYRIDAPHLQKISLGDWFAKANDSQQLTLRVIYV